MTGIRKTLEHLKNQHQTAFIPFIMGGDPDLKSTPQILKTLVAAGADIIEIGVPFSDPIADGPTNQQAAERALANGTSLNKILALLSEPEIRQLKVPLILFSYANPIFKMGLENFAKQAHNAGVSGVLLVDIPPEEVGEIAPILHAAELELISLATPTTPPERLALINTLATGCVYYVARAGVTGARSELSDSLSSELKAVRTAIDAPLIVGFGISTPEHVRILKAQADGVVVGSALVKTIAEAASTEEGCTALDTYVRSLTQVLKEKSDPC